MEWVGSVLLHVFEYAVSNTHLGSMGAVGLVRVAKGVGRPYFAAIKVASDCGSTTFG